MASTAFRSKVVILFVCLFFSKNVVDSHWVLGSYIGSLCRDVWFGVRSSLSIILLRKPELIALICVATVYALHAPIQKDYLEGGGATLTTFILKLMRGEDPNTTKSEPSSGRQQTPF